MYDALSEWRARSWILKFLPRGTVVPLMFSIVCVCADSYTIGVTGLVCLGWVVGCCCCCCCCCFIMTFTFQLNSYWSRRFYPQRSSGQAVFIVSSLLPPGTCLQFLSRIGFSIPTALRFSSNVANSRSRAFRWSTFTQEKVPTSMYVHSVRIELAKLILVGTRTTYQATGDACNWLIST